MQAVLDYLEQHPQEAEDRLCAFLRIPSISNGGPSYAPAMQEGANFLAQALRELGMHSVEVAQTPGNPIVSADWLGAPGKPTILIYGHYDVQTTGPEDAWISPPFAPAVRDGRLYARGAADDKGQIWMHVEALRAHLETTGALPVNVKLLFEGEEEMGSTHLLDFVSDRREQLRCDAALVSDNQMWALGEPAIVYGLRGLIYLQMEVQTGEYELHSGAFGGVVENPLRVLVDLLAQLKAEDGRVLVPQFYDRVKPISPLERERLASLNADPAEYRRAAGAYELITEPGYSLLETLWARPTLDINGIWGGYAGHGVKTVIPERAGAKLSCRLVPDQDPDEIISALQAYLHARCPDRVRLSFETLYRAHPFLSDVDALWFRAAERALEQGFGKAPRYVRTGGSNPVEITLTRTLHVPCIVYGISQADAGEHAPNEHLVLSNYRGGIRSTAILLHELGQLSADRSA